MKQAKISILFLAVALALFAPFTTATADFLLESAEKEKVTIHFFDDRLCPVCSEAKNFIQGLQSDYPEIDLKIYPISDTQKLREVAEKYGFEDYRIMAPTIFIDGKLFQFNDFGSRQEETVISAIEGRDFEENGRTIRIPLIGVEIDINEWSLLAITVILGSLDGFNVCSIGALVLVISIVLVLDSRKKMLFYGGLFILTAVLVYGVLVFVWGKLFEALVGHLEILRIIVGLAAFGGGLYFLKEFWRFFRYGPYCEASDSELVRKATNKLRKAFEQPGKGGAFLAGSVAFFAVVITIVELPCSIGVPIAFTGILVERGVSLLAYTLYILAYLFFYMLIEIIIFLGAVMTKSVWFSGSRAITWITFAGVAVLFYLAFYYLF